MRRLASTPPLDLTPKDSRLAEAVASPTALVLVTAGELRALVAEELAKLHANAPANQDAPASEWLTAEDAAAFMNLHPRTLARMARRGELAVAKIGRHARYRRSDLAAFLERRAQAGGR